MLDLEIERLSSDGTGIGHAPDGRIVFAPLTAPGDRVRAKVVGDKRNFMRVDVHELLRPGADRITPPCPVFGRCGGCSWQHIDYAAQVLAKQAILSDALTRIGRQTLNAPIEVTPSPRSFGYRGRTRVLVADGLTGYRRATSDRHVPVSDCPILMPQLNAALTALAASRPVDGEWELALGDPDSAHPDGVRVLPLITGHEAGSPLDITVGADTVHIAPGGFAQANPLLFEVLIDAVCDATGSGSRLLELYAGSGFFTLPLARRFADVMAVESNMVAARYLRDSARTAGLAGIEVCDENVETFVCGLRFMQFAADVVFVDPPRAGLGSVLVQALSKPGPRRLIYLSCDPATLARDVAGFTEAKWKLVSAIGFDLFPQTPHVEGLVVLER